MSAFVSWFESSGWEVRLLDVWVSEADIFLLSPIYSGKIKERVALDDWLLVEVNRISFLWESFAIRTAHIWHRSPIGRRQMTQNHFSVSSNLTGATIKQ